MFFGVVKWVRRDGWTADNDGMAGLCKAHRRWPCGSGLSSPTARRARARALRETARLALGRGFGHGPCACGVEAIGVALAGASFMRGCPCWTRQRASALPARRSIDTAPGRAASDMPVGPQQVACTALCTEQSTPKAAASSAPCTSLRSSS
jgi:hypothetical protein